MSLTDKRTCLPTKRGQNALTLVLIQPLGTGCVDFGQRVLVQALRARRYELLQQLAAVDDAPTTMADAIHQQCSQDKAAATNHSMQAVGGPDLAQVCRDRSYEDMLTGYRLTGRSIFPMSSTEVGIRLETFYQGQYYEPYFIFLRRSAATGHLTVVKHTLPSLVSLDQLQASPHTDIHAFLDEIEEPLQALVARREQVNQVLRSRLAETIDADQSVTHVEFIITAGTKGRIRGHLDYDSLTAVRPSQVRFTLQYHDSEPETPWNAPVEPFYTQPLIEAIETVFSFGTGTH
ncbi:hypothetical protein H4R34_001924 [Dimargaris verticillata]|uniref:Uncharacterized protein n=1 Tax=Dimargaris verticillata TaxID=2761393 RepID=A0A9W8E9T5_9FUNG|nr:hypothetical protein H4R34_001924 [Dimargaris verticillata]